MHRNQAVPVILLAASLLLAVAACSDDNNDSVIRPISARIDITPVATDPVVFLQKNPGDTSNADDVVVVDVMLRHTAGAVFSHINLDVTFNPGVVQVGQVDMSATPLGDCTSSAPCAPLCLDNVNPASPTPKANTTGDLILGVSARPLCPGANVSGETRLLTIGFIGASVGTSPVTLVDGAGSGDCEILDATPAPLPIPCQSGGATVTVTR